MKGFGSRKVARYGGALLALAAVVVAVASAQAAPALKKNYTVSIAPGLAAPGSSGQYTISLGNAATSSQTLGSANIAVPDGFTVTGISPAAASPGAPGWSFGTSSSNSQVVMWRAGTSANALAPGTGTAAMLSVTAATSFTCPRSSWIWKSAVKQSNDFSGSGNDFTLKTGTPDASLTAARLAFTTQPPLQTLASAALSPAVQVTLQDACGTTLASVAGTVGASIDTNPSDGTLGGTTTRALTNGVATFDDLGIDASGVGYTLIATPGSTLNVDSSAPSDAFNVIDSLCTRSGGSSSCTASNSVQDTTVSVPTPPTGNAQTALSVGKPGKTLAGADCTGGLLAQVGSLATIAPQSYPSGSLLSVTLTYAASVATTAGVSGYVVCVVKNGTSTEANACNKSAPPCVSNRSRNGSGALVVVLTIDANDPVGGTYR
jgi:hypothetical protein